MWGFIQSCICVLGALLQELKPDWAYVYKYVNISQSKHNSEKPGLIFFPRFKGFLLYLSMWDKPMESDAMRNRNNLHGAYIYSRMVFTWAYSRQKQKYSIQK